VFFKDGKTATVAVFEFGDDNNKVRMISTNGKVDAGLGYNNVKVVTPDEATMLLAAALPLSMRDGFERVGVIGFGSGMTTHALMGHAKVGLVDTVEIEPSMVEGARHLGKRVERAFNDPRSHVVIDDAKAYFASVPKKYDLIISEPSNPWMGGTASLFSTEFYQYVPRQLNEDGLFVQWVQLYEITPELVNSVLSALLLNFKDAKAFLANDTDLILVASPHGKVPDLTADVFKQPKLAEDLARIGVSDLRDLQDTMVMNRKGLEAHLRLYPHRVNSDMFPVLKLEAPKARFENARADDFNNLGSTLWPIIRYLGGPEPRTQQAPQKSWPLQLESVRKGAEANQIFAALVDSSVAAEETPSAFNGLQVDALRGLAAACKLGERPARDTTMIFSIAGETAAFLDPARMQRMWGKPEWVSCTAGDATVDGALAFMSAVAADRHEEVLRLGQELFEGEHGATVLGDQVSGRYVFGAMQYAALSTQSSQAAQQLVERYWTRLNRRAQGDASLRLITLLATGAGAQSTHGQ
jgi:spermidine synthase